MKNKFILIDKEEYTIDLNDSEQYDSLCILDLSTNNNLILNFNCLKDIKIIFLSFNKNIKNKMINIKCNILNKNNKIFIINNLFLNNSSVFLKFNANDKKAESNNFIDLKINAIIEDINSCFRTCPIYDFFTNLIDAKHALNIGSINQNYLDYIMSRGLSLSFAKKLFYQAQINMFLSYLNINQKDMVNQQISNFLGE